MRFRIIHLLVATFVIGLLLSVAMFVISPLVRLASSINTAQQRIINDFDHVSIRDAAVPLLTGSADRFVEQYDWPKSVAETDPAPKSVHVTNGMIVIEYGSGFAHYGLIIDPSNAKHTGRKKLGSGIYFYETE
jgi:hypothetical protein